MDHNHPNDPMEPREADTSREGHTPEDGSGSTVQIGGKKLQKRTVFYISATVLALLLFAVAVHTKES